jgi:hypothetical protein
VATRPGAGRLLIPFLNQRMKNILKAIGAGLALGVALFLVPFVGRIILFVLLVRVAFRLLFGGRGRRGMGRRNWAAHQHFGFGPMPGGPVPIDNQWYRPTAPAGPASYVVVS